MQYSLCARINIKAEKIAFIIEVDNNLRINQIREMVEEP